MGNAVATSGSGLWFHPLIASYTERPDYVRRTWLEERITAAVARAQYVLVTGEPGAGKTAVAASLVANHPGWLRYFVRRDSRSVLEGTDAGSLLLRLGHQLASLHPDAFDPPGLEVVVKQRIGTVAASGAAVGVMIDDLRVSPFYRTALRVDQEASTLEGRLAGIEIRHATLEPRLEKIETLQYLALLDPVAVLAARDPAIQVVIAIDGLDEVGAEQRDDLVSWLCQAPLPPCVRVVLLSRPTSRLDPLRARLGDALETVRIDDAAAAVRADIERYVADHIQPAVASVVGLAEDFTAQLVIKAHGNFAYVTAFRRAVEAASDDPATLQRLVALREVPQTLRDLYWWFLELTRSAIERLGALEVARPLSADDRAVPAWEGVGQRVLGVLSVARAPLTGDQLIAFGGIRAFPRDVRNVIRRLLPFLDEIGGRYRLFHSSLAELMTSADTRARFPDDWIDPGEWEQRIASAYRGGRARWSEVAWAQVDDYGLLELPHHIAAIDTTGRALLELVDPAVRVAARSRFGTELVFQRIVDLALNAAHQAEDPLEALCRTITAGTVRAQLRHMQARFTPATLALLARLGRHDEALAHIEAMRPSELQFVSLCAVMDQLTPEVRATLGPYDGVQRIVTAALEISPHESIFAGMERNRSLQQAAIRLAPHALERALRLVEGDREATDAVLRAAVAATPDPEAAARIADRITEDLSVEVIALAQRSAEPRRSALLDRVLASLPEAFQDRAPLLAHVASTDARCADAARARLVREAAALDGEARRKDDVMSGIVRAAEVLHARDPAEAERLLGMIEPTPGSTRWAVSAAARRWVAWGHADRARPLLASEVAEWRAIKNWSMAAREIARIAEIVRTYDPAGASSLIEEALALVTPHIDHVDEFASHMVDGALSGIIGALLDVDPRRALELTAHMPRTTWINGDEALTMGDRLSAMAMVGLHALPEDPGLAHEVLERCLAAQRTPVVLGRANGKESLGGMYRLATTPTGSEGQMRVANFVTYVTNVWNYWITSRKWRWYRTTPEVVRSIEHSPLSGPRYSYASAFARIVGATARSDLDTARALVAHIVDPVERTIAWADLAVATMSRRLDPHAALVELQRSLDEIPAYVPEVSDDNMQGQIWRYVSPAIRARFEAAVRIAPLRPNDGQALIDPIHSPYLTMAVMMNGALDEIAAEAAHGRFESTRMMMLVASSSEELLADVWRRGAVAVLAGPDAALAGEVATQIQHPGLAADAKITLAGTAGDVAACGQVLADLAAPVNQVVEVAVHAAEVTRPRDPVAADRMIALARERLAAPGDPKLTAAGHLVLARVAASPVAEIRAADAAIRSIANIYNAAELRADLLSAALATGDRELICELARASIEEGWHPLMAALERAALPLAAHGRASLDRLDAALRTALRVLDPAQPQPPAEIDGVAALG